MRAGPGSTGPQLAIDGVTGALRVDVDHAHALQAAFVPRDDLDLGLAHAEQFGDELDALRVALPPMGGAATFKASASP